MQESRFSESPIIQVLKEVKGESMVKEVQPVI